MADFFEITEDNFETEVKKSALPVLLEFGAPWCQPCKRLEPILTQLAAEWQGKVRLCKVDVDVSPNLAMQYQVMGVPTVILFRQGQVLERVSGLQTRDRLVDKFLPHL